jgi:acyl-CoA reductase-like NAD-dependent aldehyde dehydrogenase
MLIRRDDGQLDGELSAIIEKATSDATDEVINKVLVTCTPKAVKGCGTVNFAEVDGSIRESLAAARKSIETSAGLSDEQRRAALEGLDEALREMSEQLKSAPTSGQ